MNVAAGVLTFREGLEAALIIAIVLTYLRRTGRAGRAGQVWAGAGAAGLLTVAFVAVLQALGATFTYPAQGIFEGVTSLLAVAMVTGMTFWMARQGRQLKGTLEREVQEALDAGAGAGRGGHRWGRWGRWGAFGGLFGVAFLAVGREGVETGLFLAAAAFASSGAETLAGGVVGLLAACAVAWGVYAAGLRLNLRVFFRAAGALLVFFGAAMLRYAVHEFEEVGVLPPLVERVWDTGAWLPDGEGLGAILSALVGYTAHPSLTQAIAYAGYFAAVVAALAWPSLREALGAAARRRSLPASTGAAALVALGTASAVVLAGCERGAAGTGGASGPLPAGAREVAIVARDNVFEPTDVRLEAGKPVRITFANEGRNVHVPEIKDMVPETRLAAGQRKSFDVTPKAGSYRLYCEIHDRQMEGAVSVQ